MSPILILALLFSSCDDSSKESTKEPAVTLKLTSETITATGMTGGETGDVKTTAAPDSVTGGTVEASSIASSALTVTIGESGNNSSVTGTITLAESKALTDLNGLETLVFKNVKIGQNETAYDMTLKGAAFNGTDESWTITEITFAAAKPEPESLDITTIKYSSGSNVTATGTYEYASGGSLELQGSGFTPACEGKLTVTVAADKACTIAAEGFKIPATAKDTLSETGLTWSGSQSFDSATITGVVIKGTYTADDGGTLTISSLEINKQAEEPAVTVTTIEVTGIGSISNFSENAPESDAAEAITLTPPSGVTPSTALKGKLKTDGSVEFSAVNLSASDDTAIKTGWKISATWNNSSSKACTITQVEITPTYESASKKLTFDASGLTINVAE